MHRSAQRFSLLIFAALVAFLVGCGGPPSGTPSRSSSQSTTIPKSAIKIPPESARKPEGAKFRPSGQALGLHPSATHIPTIDSRGLHLIESFEGYRRCAYWDPYGRVWTAGYGQTRGIYSGFCFANQLAAQNDLATSVRNSYEPFVRAIVGPFGQNQVDALDSFAYNLGPYIFTGSLRFDLQSASRWPAAEAIMLRYDHAGGVVLAGLARRRREEVALFRQASPKPKPVRTLAQAYTRRRVLRRELLNKGCDSRRDHRQKLGPKCSRWFREGAQVNSEIRSKGGR